MTKILKKSLACLLAFALCFTAVASCLAVSAAAPAMASDVSFHTQSRPGDHRDDNANELCVGEEVRAQITLENIQAGSSIGIEVDLPTGLNPSEITYGTFDKGAKFDIVSKNYDEETGKFTMILDVTTTGDYVYFVYFIVGENVPQDRVFSLEYKIEATFASDDAVYKKTSANAWPMRVFAEHVVETLEAVAPTCTETGLTEGSHCARCLETFEAQEEVEATGHAWDAGVPNPDATCDSEGTLVYTCANDPSHTYTEAISAKGHTPAAELVDNEDGTHSEVCDVCGAVLSTAEHDFTDGDCACGAKDPDAVVPCAHANKTFVSATMNSDSEEEGDVVATISFKCSDCNEDLPVEDVKYLRNAQLAGSNANILLDEMTELKLRLNNNNYGGKNAKDLYIAYTQTFYGGATRTKYFDMTNYTSAPTASKNEYSWSIPVDFDKFADDFEIHVFRQEADGTWVTGLVRHYSVKASLMSLVTGASTTTANKKMAANLLRAGAKSQLVVDKNIDPNLLVDKDLVGDYAALIKTGTPTVEQTEANWKPSTGHKDLGYAYFTTPTALLGEAVKLSTKLDLRYVTAEITDLKIRYTYTTYDGATESGFVYANELEYLPDDNNRYALKFAVKAPDMRAAITFTVYNGDTRISNDIIYSLEGTFRQVLNSSKGSDYQDVIDAIMNYSDTVVEEKTKK